MANYKIALFVLLAIGSTQVQCASVAEPAPVDLDIFLGAKEAIKIVQTVISGIEKGIAESKPSIDILIKQLTPELGEAVRKVLDKAHQLIKDERVRVEFVIKEVQEVLDAVAKIKTCTDPQKKDFEKVLSNFENGLLAAVRASAKENNQALNDLKQGFIRIRDKGRKLFDDEVKNVIGCIKPGNQNAKKCILDEVEKIKKGVLGVGADSVLFLDEAVEVLTSFALDAFGKAGPSIETFKKEIDPVLQKVSDCIAKQS